MADAQTGTFRCVHCSSKFKRKFNLARHMKNVHAPDEEKGACIRSFLKRPSEIKYVKDLILFFFENMEEITQHIKQDMKKTNVKACITVKIQMQEINKEGCFEETNVDFIGRVTTLINTKDVVSFFNNSVDKIIIDLTSLNGNGSRCYIGKVLDLQLHTEGFNPSDLKM
jgi:hypothetical protein